MDLPEDFAVWFFDQFLDGEEMGGFTGDSLGMVLSHRLGAKGDHRVPEAGASREPSATNGGFPVDKRSPVEDQPHWVGLRSNDSRT